MIYQHATRDRDKSIAAALSKLLDATRDGSKWSGRCLARCYSAAFPKGRECGYHLREQMTGIEPA
jgi:hypothetical protein